MNIIDYSSRPDLFGKECRLWAANAITKPIKTLSLFSGAGGLDIGFCDTGFSIQSCIEIEKKYVNTLIQNAHTGGYFGKDCKIICDDIRNYYPPEDLDIDFIIGGPPCQTFSAAGRRASGVLGIDDHRGKLFQEYIRLLKTLRPKGFLFENVYGIIGAQGGTAWKQIQEAFSNVGYQLYHRILDAADYGVPQFRERLFIIGIQEGEYKFPRPTHGPDSESGNAHLTAGEAIMDVPQSTEILLSEVKGRYGYLLNDIPPGLNYSFYTKKMGYPHPIFAWRSKFSDFLYKADPAAPVRTLKAQGGQYTGPFHWDNRPFSIAELKRLQTFPDQYHITGTRLIALQQLGNSVPPQLARILALSVLNQVFGIEIPFGLSYLNEEDILSFRRRKAEKTKDYQKKASFAIANIQPYNSRNKLPQKNYKFKLTEQFEIIESENGYQIEAKEEGNELIIQLSTADSKESCRVDIAPVELDKWPLMYNKVTLNSNCLKYDGFVVLWKFFEKILREISQKADLIQLYGYYQYESSFRCSMSIHHEKNIDKKWLILAEVVSGKWCGKNYDLFQLAAGWNIKTSEVLEIAQFLKSIGYEVRNSKTNPQLPQDHYLLPYPFPTLNKMSVQLRKSLL